jgi:hypothetical protein
MSRKLTTKEVIEQFKNVHGNKYDYSLVEYKTCQEKVKIICPTHGIFEQTPLEHKQGNNCPKCAHRSYRYTTKEWVEKAKSVHGDKYDYSKVNYINNKTNVCIICPKHGEFWQMPTHHLHGSGCPNCYNSKLEDKTEKELLSKNILFEKRKHFKWLGGQHLDFFLPKNNIAIECQGIQHFKPSDFGGKGKDFTNKRFNEDRKRDKKKLEKCNENNIFLFYINYNDSVKEKIDELCKLLS